MSTSPVDAVPPVPAIEPDTPGPDTPNPDGASRFRGPLLFVLLLAPYLVVAAAWYRSGWFPVQDHAVLALKLDELWSGEPPLLGAFSRYGWSHPGPLWFLALAPFKLLGGGDSWIVVGSIVWFGAGVATAPTLVRNRWGDAAGIVAVAATIVWTAGAGSFSVIVPWNPHLALAWYPVMLVLLASAAALRRASDLAAATFVAACLVQLHIGYLVLVGVPLAATWLVWVHAMGGVREWRTALGALRNRAALAWLAVTVLVWVPPLVQQLARGRDGNLWRIGRFFLDRPDEVGEALGPLGGTGLIGGALRLPPVGLGSSGEATDPFNGWIQPSPWWTIVPLVVLLVAATVRSVRSSDAASLRALIAVDAALAAAVLAAGQVVGERWPYIFVWRYPVAATAAAAAILALFAGTTAARRLSSSALVVPLLFGSAVLCSVLTVVRLDDVEVGRVLPREPDTERLVDQVSNGGDPPEGPFVIERLGGILEGVGDGAQTALVRAGWDARVPDSLGFKWGADRVAETDGSVPVWLVTEDSAATSVAISQPDGDVRAVVTPLRAADDADLVDGHLEVLAALRAAGRLDLASAVGSSLLDLVLDEAGIEVDPDVVDRVVELNTEVERSGRCRCALVETDGLPAPTLEEAIDRATLTGG